MKQKRGSTRGGGGGQFRATLRLYQITNQITNQNHKSESESESEWLAGPPPVHDERAAQQHEVVELVPLRHVPWGEARRWGEGYEAGKHIQVPKNRIPGTSNPTCMTLASPHLSHKTKWRVLKATTRTQCCQESAVCTHMSATWV